MSELLPTVGFIGLGTMGTGMAHNLARKGFRLSLASRRFERAARLAEELSLCERENPNPERRAAVAFRDPGELAGACDVIISCVPDAPEVREVHLGERGTASTARPGTVVVDCSTIAPQAAREIAASLSERGILFLDAPVSGGQKGAIEGTLTFFIGGEEQALERARPVLLSMGRRLTHLGGSGAGQLGKAVNQIIVAGNLMAVCEGLAFAEKAGLPLANLHDALTSGAATSWALEVLGKKMLSRDFAPAFAIKHQQKDLAIVLSAAREKGVPLPGTALVHQLLSALEAGGESDKGTQALLTLYERLSRA